MIQSYYLSCAFPGRKLVSYSDEKKILDDELLTEHDIVLLPNFAFPNISLSDVDLVVNVRSLSEMSMETIQEYFRQIERIGSLFFFHENIAMQRLDKLHGIPSSEFPTLKNYTLLYTSESKWPRYNWKTSYPCSENLFIRNDRLG